MRSSTLDIYYGQPPKVKQWLMRLRLSWCRSCSVMTRSAAIAADLNLSLNSSLELDDREGVTPELEIFWNHVSEQILDLTRDRIVDLGCTERSIELRCYGRRLVPLSEAVNFGPSFLVVGARSLGLGGLRFSPPGFRLVSSVLGRAWQGRRPMPEREHHAADLASIAEILLRTPTPWIGDDLRRSRDFWGWRKIVSESGHLDPISLSADVVSHHSVFSELN